MRSVPTLPSSGSSLRSAARVSRTLLNVVTDASDKRLPVVARMCLVALGVQLRRLKEQILEFDRRSWLGTDLMTSWSAIESYAEFGLQAWPNSPNVNG